MTHRTSATATWAEVRGIGLLGDVPVVLLTIPRWDPERLLAVPEASLPAAWQERLAAGLRLPVHANLAARREAELALTVRAPGALEVPA